MNTTENALILSENVTAISVYRTEGGAKEIVKKIKEDAKSIVLDASTAEGRKEIASVAYKIARSKTALDEMGKELVEADKQRDRKSVV